VIQFLQHQVIPVIEPVNQEGNVNVLVLDATINVCPPTAIEMTLLPPPPSPRMKDVPLPPPNPLPLETDELLMSLVNFLQQHNNSSNMLNRIKRRL